MLPVIWHEETDALVALCDHPQGGGERHSKESLHDSRQEHSASSFYRVPEFHAVALLLTYPWT